ncbi:cell division protein ZapA [Capnocytophaga haemolytica]|jgi:hypothetical protein|uniref:Cell division protein ZapA n=1 Tax=Capnocytophaga haemolytica TaxID=45243 RepID=A0AAX2GZ79_9FLAO|nr:cell division protein ZapA [Capnocytophaga haemolytica]AMD84502.1 cell division protein ZapA [Capnocytophaga haemolytica]SFO22882.1 cell division protein ZapA [Capnocytophaga haemolytica]SNV09857.1 Uncharacterized protein conserved in bacteria [Capnocytophaga haemolytica]
MEEEMLRINLAVGERSYPLNIKREEEEAFRRAAKKVNEMIKNFEQQYQLKDRQDALAMCAIVLATQVEQVALSESKEDEQLKAQLSRLDSLLSEML